MSFTREEQVELFQMPYTLLLFRTSNNESESLFEEEPDELYFTSYKEAKATYDHLVATMEDNPNDYQKFSHIMLMKYGFNGNPEDGDCLDEWDEIDESDVTYMKQCCLCDDFLSGDGNNAQPLNDGRCCYECNVVKVIPARLGLIVRTEA